MFASPDRIEDGYFPLGADEDYIAGPDFVNLDEKLEAISRDTDQDDEAAVRRLVRRGNAASTPNRTAARGVRLQVLGDAPTDPHSSRLDWRCTLALRSGGKRLI